MKLTLTDLLSRDGVTAHWFWTHEVPTGPHSEHEVWDLLLVRNTHEPKLWVTDGDTRRTAYFQGIGGCAADSRRETGGERREPELVATLTDLLADALDVDNNPTFADWCTDHAGERTTSAHEQLAEYNGIRRTHATLRAWLGDQYDEYTAAALSL